MHKLRFLTAAVALLCVLVAPTVSAAPAPDVEPSPSGPSTSAAGVTCPPGQKQLGDTPTCCPLSTPDNATSCLFEKYLNPAVRLLSIVAGLAVVAGIMLGGIQFASSAGDPKKAADGKGKVIKALFALVTFMFLFSLLQFFSPNGLDGKTGLADTSKPASAANCTHTFFGLKPWYAYLPTTTNSSPTFDINCNIVDFEILGNGANSGLLPVALVLVDDLARIAAIIAVIFVIIGGIQYVTSQGEPDRTRSAKDSIINALIGLVIAMVAASLVSYIGTRISS
jgi:quinol-cytochrome oxidoreductase complex cytochrome b subunit